MAQEVLVLGVVSGEAMVLAVRSAHGGGGAESGMYSGAVLGAD